MASAHRKLEGKVAIITGASSGIGAGTAEEFAIEGCAVALVGRDEQRLKETAGKCEKSLPKTKILVIVTDLSKDDGSTMVVAKTIAEFGKLDVLVNNAGILRTGSIETFTLEEYDEIMNINVRSILLLTKEATPYLIQSKGNIINVSSITGIRPYPNLLPYCISKAALDHMTRCTALDLAPKGVRVNSVNPGVIMTNIHRRAGMNEREYEQFVEHSKSTHAMGRVGTVQEVARTIVFLASEEAAFITGQNLAVDGGRGLMGQR